MGEKLDVIIFGATGFTGMYVVKDAVELLKDFKWGVAGRNKGRLENVLRDVGAKVGKDLSATPVIVADVDDEASIVAMAKRGKVIINCCGPYQLYGEVVVKACVEAGTHHLDISGEPQYINKIQLKHQDMAVERGAYVVSTCGFESLPADLGVVYAEQQFAGTVNSVEMYVENSFRRVDRSSKAVVHSGTWASLMYALKNSMELITLLRSANKRPLPELKPKLKLNWLTRKPEFLRSYVVPFPVTDRDAVDRSQRYLYEYEKKRPTQFQAYLGFPSLFSAIFCQIALLFIVLLSQFGYTRKLLLRYPHIATAGLVSHQGPLEVNANAQRFKATFVVRGWSTGTPLTQAPDKEMMFQASGLNPFYGLCSIGMISAAKTILREGKQMPSSGGVMAPAAAFARTSLIDELAKHKHGIKFEILK